MQMNPRAKKATIAGVVALVAASTAVAYAVFSGSGETLTNAVSTALNPAKAIATELSAEAPEDYISASRIATTADGKFAFVNDETAQKVYKLDLTTNQKVKEVSVGAKVNNVAVSGDDLYVLYGELGGKVAKYSQDLVKGAEVVTGHTPDAAYEKDGKLFVANRFSNTVSVVNTADMTKVKDIEVSREPLALAATGNKLYVGCNLQDGVANKGSVASKISVIDMASQTKTTDIPLLNGSVNVKDLCVSPDGQYVYVAHGLGRYAYPTTQLDRGWVNTNAVTILDTAKDERVNTVLLDQVELAAANPWGIAATDDKLVVALSGTQEAIVIDRNAMHQKIKDVEGGKTVVKTLTSADKIPDYLNFLDGTRTRVALTGQNPRGLAIANDKAYITQYISGDVCVLDLKDNNKTSTITLGVQPEQDQARYGESLWNDATIAYQNWNSCSSCHPDAHMDSLNWDETGDSLGTPRSTKSMVYAHRTPPALVTGCVITAEENVRGSLKLVLSEEVNLAIDAYLKTLQPVQSPNLKEDGTLTEDAQKGKALFEANCASCHSGPFFTDMKMHAPNHTYEGWEGENARFDTPTLVEVWRTAPYGVDGSYKTLYDYIRDDKAVKEKKLTDDQCRQLAAYVGSIGNEGEVYGLEQVKVENKDEATANRLIKGSKITEVTFRRQLDTDKDAIATFELFDKSGKSLKKVEKELSKDQSKRTAVSMEVNYDVPKDLENGSYYTVTIVNKADKNEALATPFTATVEE